MFSCLPFLTNTGVMLHVCAVYGFRFSLAFSACTDIVFFALRKLDTTFCGCMQTTIEEIRIKHGKRIIKQSTDIFAVNSCAQRRHQHQIIQIRMCRIQMC